MGKKPETNWILGAGYQFTPKFEASLSSVQGFRDQCFDYRLDGMNHIKEVYILTCWIEMKHSTA